MIKINNLNYKIDNKTILKNINLNLENGVYALLGLNGAGKTTFLNTIATLYKPTTGDILYNDISIIKNPKPLQKELGYMSQNVGIILDFTIEQNLYYFGLLKGCKSKELKQKIPQLLDVFNLLSERKTKTFNLSGGLKQRLGIALSLINNPKVLLLDEPINNLDSYEREKFYNLLKDISENCIIIISTHLINEIAKFSNELLIINKGSLAFKGSVNELYRQNNTNLSIEIEELFKKLTQI